MLFKGFVKFNVRKNLCEIDIPVDRAIDFLKENKYNIIEDEDGETYTQEELENVKSFGSKDRTEFDKSVDPKGTIPEDSYRKLFGTLGDNSESSSERDNQCDQSTAI